MVTLEFNDLVFHDDRDKFRVFFLKNFYFDMHKKELGAIGPFKIGKDRNSISFEGNEVSVRKKFNFLLEQKLQTLKSIQGKPAVFIHEGFLPLIGSLYFGILDRDTNIIEVRPITGCNLNCIFCSVDMCRRERDFVVSVDYLVKEAEKLAELKLKQTQVNEIEMHINAQGEPLLYAPLAELISRLRKIKGVKTISIDTNGTLLTEKIVDELVDAGLTRFNISLNAVTPELVKKIASVKYDVRKLMEMCRYIAKKCDILIASVLLKDINEAEIEKIIPFALKLKEIRNQRKPEQKTPFIGVQNFLEYEYGKKPTKQLEWTEFFSKLTELEKKYNTHLIMSRENFDIKKANVLQKPFSNDDYVRAKIVCKGMFKKEKLCTAQDRIISVRTSVPEGKTIGVKITRSKYNVFYAEEA